MKCDVRSEKCGVPGGLIEEGFEILADVLPADHCDALAADLSGLFESERSSAGTRIAGVRNLLQLSRPVAEFASSPRCANILKDRVGRCAFPVRALFFDKTADANWRVPWHQDLSIAVAGRIDAPGFSGWSRKDGVVHVQPPREILETMVTLRLHLDDCSASNGALKVIPRSHAEGKLDARQISEWSGRGQALVCEVPKGGALLMRPLLLHSSAPAASPVHRRVLHIEFAVDGLPQGLKWLNGELNSVR